MGPPVRLRPHRIDLLPAQLAADRDRARVQRRRLIADAARPRHRVRRDRTKLQQRCGIATLLEIDGATPTAAYESTIAAHADTRRAARTLAGRLPRTAVRRPPRPGIAGEATGRRVRLRGRQQSHREAAVAEFLVAGEVGLGDDQPVPALVTLGVIGDLGEGAVVALSAHFEVCFAGGDGFAVPVRHVGVATVRAADDELIATFHPHQHDRPGLTAGSADDVHQDVRPPEEPLPQTPLGPAEHLRLQPRVRPGARILEIMCWRNKKLPSLIRGRPAPYRPAKPSDSCSCLTESATFFHSTPNGGLASR